MEKDSQWGFVLFCFFWRDFKFYFILCVLVFYLQLRLYTMCVQRPQELEEGI